MGTYRNRRKFEIRSLLIMLFGLALLLSPFSFAVFADDGPNGEMEVNGEVDVNGGDNGALDCEKPDGNIVVVDSGKAHNISGWRDNHIYFVNQNCEALGNLKINSMANDPSILYLKVSSVDTTSPKGLEKSGPILDFQFFQDESGDYGITDTEGEFELSLRVDDGVSDAKMFHETESGNWVEIEEAIYEDGFITAPVINFSVYGVFKEPKPEPERINIKVEKEWLGTVQDEAVAHLIIDGERYQEEEALLNEKGNWEYIFYNIVYQHPGEEPLEFGIEEEPIDGYETIITGNAKDGFIITNYELIDIQVTKEWVDGKEESVTVHLYQDNEPVRENGTVVLDESNNWTHVFEGMRVQSGDQPHEYTIVEDEISGYHTDISGNARDGFTIVNTKVAPEPETVDITVTKEWVGKAGESATVYLVIDGDKAEDTKVTLSEDNDWTHTYEGLLVAINGTELEYTIVEEPMEGYEVEVSGNVEEGFVVTNTEIVPEPEVEVEEEEPVEATGQMLPKTATNNFTLGLIGALMIALGSGFYFINRRRTRKEN